MTEYEYVFTNQIKTKYKKYVNKVKEKNFVLDCTTAIKSDYDPF